MLPPTPNWAIGDPFVDAIELIQLIGLRHNLDLSLGGIRTHWNAEL